MVAVEVELDQILVLELLTRDGVRPVLLEVGHNVAAAVTNAYAESERFSSDIVVSRAAAHSNRSITKVQVHTERKMISSKVQVHTKNER